ncbi:MULTISPECIES: DUF7946 domain-containing protein [Vibrio]|uniref:DUF7946 domain-containing protein n=2 Tax=Vibrionaceae TaxID=641 RepID=UPI000507321C|nr:MULTISPECIES: hypothetical protein [Vibrio]KFK48209.1 hypothetical protein JS87_22820 [Vibrio vulnificus]CAK6715064.1 conserved hypothetical protein [Vibrio harveyi]HDY8229971.1 hypothetical protein [Vibrio vulnificus]
MNNNIEFTLSYEGGASDHHEIDFYDVSQALIGFQRTLALTTHLVLNNKIITQAPALKGAKILALPPEEGSWKITASIVLGGLYTFGTAPSNTPIGHIVYSLYDYVVSESLGFHVDYDKSLGKLYEEAKEQNKALKVIKQHQADSLIEKCSTAISDIHRPITKNKTALEANICASINGVNKPISARFNEDTFSYIQELITLDTHEVIYGRVSSYNSNTFKGRIYVVAEGRPVSFELFGRARTPASLQLIVASLSANVQKNHDDPLSNLFCRVKRITTKSGLLKSYEVYAVSNQNIVA